MSRFAESLKKTYPGCKNDLQYTICCLIDSGLVHDFNKPISQPWTLESVANVAKAIQDTFSIYED